MKVYSKKSEKIWKNLEESERIWTATKNCSNLKKSEGIWRSLIMHKNCSNLKKSVQPQEIARIWRNLKESEEIWSDTRIARIWRNLFRHKKLLKSKEIWRNLKKSEGIWWNLKESEGQGHVEWLEVPQGYQSRETLEEKWANGNDLDLFFLCRNPRWRGNKLSTNFFAAFNFRKPFWC